MQAKDIPDLDLLMFIDRKEQELGRWVMVYDLEAPYSELPANLFRAKMAKLINRGLLDGCTCGCRGDYMMTPKGYAFIEERGGSVAPQGEPQTIEAAYTKLLAAVANW